ncbi:hypothetical protein [Nonomuraea sp. NPDC052265]
MRAAALRRILVTDTVTQPAGSGMPLPADAIGRLHGDEPRRVR